MAIGGIIGGAVGFAGGWLAAREASESDVNAVGHPVTLGLLVGGAGVGMILGAGSKTVKQYPFSSTAEIYVLHEEVGKDITPAEIKLFSVFDDLKEENEQLLLVQIIRYDESKYLLLYEVNSGNEYRTKIKKVEPDYLLQQSEKINQVLSLDRN
jgi:hypothetical protein